jgi:hypothetical protein
MSFRGIMNRKWLTKDKDIHIANLIMMNYADSTKTDAITLFELVLDKKAKRMGFQLASWVVKLSDCFIKMYGVEQGDFVVRQIISNCFIGEQTVH